MMSYDHVSRLGRRKPVNMALNYLKTICTAQTHEDTQKQETDGGPCACWGRCDQWHSTKPHDRTCKSLKSKVKDLIAATDHCRGNDEGHHMYVDCSAFFEFTCDTWFHFAESIALFFTFAHLYDKNSRKSVGYLCIVERICIRMISYCLQVYTYDAGMYVHLWYKYSSTTHTHTHTSTTQTGRKKKYIHITLPQFVHDHGIKKLNSSGENCMHFFTVLALDCWIQNSDCLLHEIRSHLTQEQKKTIQRTKQK